MNRLLSSLGIGAATVDTLLPKTTVRPGETVEATIEISGGDSEQAIDALYFALLTRDGDDDHVIDRFQITDPFVLSPEETRTVTTELTVPLWTPLTTGDRRVWLKTGLDISWAIDPDDADDIEVVPPATVEALFEAIDDLGFDFRRSEIREPVWLEDRPFAQSFSYEPRTETYRDDLEGLTVICVPQDGALRTVIEIDEAEPAEDTGTVAFDSQEVFHSFDTTDPSNVRRQLESLIDQHTHTD